MVPAPATPATPAPAVQCLLTPHPVDMGRLLLVLFLTQSAWQGSGGLCAELPKIAPGSPPKIEEPDCVQWAWTS